MATISTKAAGFRVWISRSDCMPFIPLLALYLAVVLGFDHFIRPHIHLSWDSMFSDQSRYSQMAINLTQGRHDTSGINNLWSGPGYPLFLAALQLLHLPLRWAPYFNPLLLYGALVYVFKILTPIVDRSMALKATYLLGIYPPFFIGLPFVMTESLTLGLLAGALYYTGRVWQEGGRNDLLLAGFCWGLLALTKVLFGYVITALLLVFCVMGFFSRLGRKSTIIFGLSLVVCLPYLAYTWNLTGRLFYWGSAGGSALYWMSNPYPGEYGDWRSDTDALNRPEYSRHHPYLASLQPLDFVRKDAMHKREAWKNLTAHPGKYLDNWICNQGRFWFNYPFSYKQQNPYALLYMFPNALILAGLLAGGVRLVRSFATIPPLVHLCGLTFIFYWGLHSIAGSEARYLIPAVPLTTILTVVAFGRHTGPAGEDALSHSTGGETSTR